MFLCAVLVPCGEVVEGGAAVWASVGTQHVFGESAHRGGLGSVVFDCFPAVWVLAVAEDDDVGVIGVDDDVVMRTPRSLVASGALVISVTGSSSR